MKDFIRVTYDQTNDMLLHTPSQTVIRLGKNEDVDYEDIDLRLKDKYIDTQKQYNENPQRLSGLIFNTTEKCNLACSYCMVNQGNYHNNKTKTYIDYDQYDKAIDFMFQNYSEGTSFVCFFGGEPTLRKKEIFYAVNKIEKEMKDRLLKAPRYSIISNGTLLDEELLSFMDEHKMYLSVSIDGFKQMHDASRVFVDGSGSYDVIVKNLEMLKQRGRDFPLYAEATIHKGHIDLLGSDKRSGGYDFVKSLYNLGFDAVYVFPVDTDDEDLNLENVDNKDLKDFFYGVYDYYLELLLTKDSKQKAPGHFVGIYANIFTKRANKHCNAGDSTIFVNPEGDVYPCHLLYNSKYQKMGSIYEKVFDQEVLDEIRLENDRSNVKQCACCANRNLCFLWCPGSSMLSNGKIASVVNTRCKIVDITTSYVLESIGRLLKTKESIVFKENLKQATSDYKRF